MPAQARDLIVHMLNVDPMKRITIPEVRAHPWFQQKLSAYMNMTPAEIDMQRKYIDDETVTQVCQLKIPGVTAEKVVEAVQHHYQHPQRNVGSREHLVLMASKDDRAYAAMGMDRDSLPAAVMQYRHELLLAYKLLQDAKRHKQRLAEVMTALAELSKSPISSYGS